jgi:hypothetical protein
MAVPADVKVDDAAVERATLDQVWRALEPNVKQAEDLRLRAASDPAVARDPRNAALIRWFDAFEKELVALRSVHETAELLPTTDVQFARATADKLLSTLQQTREAVSV